MEFIQYSFLSSPSPLVFQITRNICISSKSCRDQDNIGALIISCVDCQLQTIPFQHVQWQCFFKLFCYTGILRFNVINSVISNVSQKSFYSVMRASYYFYHCFLEKEVRSNPQSIHRNSMVTGLIDTTLYSARNGETYQGRKKGWWRLGWMMGMHYITFGPFY